MKYKIKILSKGQIWGDVEWREVGEDGLYTIQTAAYTGNHAGRCRYAPI